MQVRTRADTCTRGLTVWMQSALKSSASAADKGAEWCAGTLTRKRWSEQRRSSLTAAVTRDVMKRQRVSIWRSPAARGRETTPDYRLAILTYKVQSTATPASLHCFLFHVFRLIVWNLLSDIVVNADSLTLFYKHLTCSLCPPNSYSHSPIRACLCTTTTVPSYLSRIKLHCIVICQRDWQCTANRVYVVCEGFNGCKWYKHQWS